MLNHYKVSGCRELGKNTTFPEHLVPAVLVECFCFGDKVVVEGAGAAQQEVRQPVLIVLQKPANLLAITNYFTEWTDKQVLRFLREF